MSHLTLLFVEYSVGYLGLWITFHADFTLSHIHWHKPVVDLQPTSFCFFFLLCQFPVCHSHMTLYVQAVNYLCFCWLCGGERASVDTNLNEETQKPHNRWCLILVNPALVNTPTPLSFISHCMDEKHPSRYLTFVSFPSSHFQKTEL